MHGKRSEPQRHNRNSKQYSNGKKVRSSYFAAECSDKKRASENCENALRLKLLNFSLTVRLTSSKASANHARASVNHARASANHGNHNHESSYHDCIPRESAESPDSMAGDRRNRESQRL